MVRAIVVSTWSFVPESALTGGRPGFWEVARSPSSVCSASSTPTCWRTTAILARRSRRANAVRRATKGSKPSCRSVRGVVLLSRRRRVDTGTRLKEPMRREVGEIDGLVTERATPGVGSSVAPRTFSAHAGHTTLITTHWERRDGSLVDRRLSTDRFRRTRRSFAIANGSEPSWATTAAAIPSTPSSAPGMSTAMEPQSRRN